jgi:hypothetical protein
VERIYIVEQGVGEDEVVRRWVGLKIKDQSCVDGVGVFFDFEGGWNGGAELSSGLDLQAIVRVGLNARLAGFKLRFVDFTVHIGVDGQCVLEIAQGDGPTALELLVGKGEGEIGVGGLMGGDGESHAEENDKGESESLHARVAFWGVEGDWASDFGAPCALKCVRFTRSA